MTTTTRVLTAEDFKSIRILLYQDIFRHEHVAFGHEHGEDEAEKSMDKIKNNYEMINKLHNLENELLGLFL